MAPDAGVVRPPYHEPLLALVRVLPVEHDVHARGRVEAEHLLRVRVRVRVGVRVRVRVRVAEPRAAAWNIRRGCSLDGMGVAA